MSFVVGPAAALVADVLLLSAAYKPCVAPALEQLAGGRNLMRQPGGWPA
ncbi:MAG: hypothetical protein ACRDPY_22485 [Streptosporangiaceae bacterium]